MTLKALKGDEGALSGRRWDHLAWKIEGGGMTLSMDRCFHRGQFSTKAGQEKVTSTVPQGLWLWRLKNFLSKLVNTTTHL